MSTDFGIFGYTGTNPPETLEAWLLIAKYAFLHVHIQIFYTQREVFFWGGGLLCFTYTCSPNEYFIKFSALLKVLEVNWH